MGRLDGEKTAPFWGLYGFEIEKYVQNEICVKNLSQYSDEIQKHCFLENGWNHYFNNFAPLLPTIKIVGYDKTGGVVCSEAPLCMSFWTQWRISRTDRTDHKFKTPQFHNFLSHTQCRDSSSPKSEFRMTKTSLVCHSERSEESCALRGWIINKSQLHIH